MLDSQQDMFSTGDKDSSGRPILVIIPEKVDAMNYMTEVHGICQKK
jgi:hypothetical protein